MLYTAEIPLDVNVFRAEVVGFLRSLPQRFEEKVSKHFRSFDQYLEHMERPNSWGDELTLQAASCLLMQPIRVVSDCDAESERLFTPFPTLTSECWGAEIVVAYLGASHYEATGPVSEGHGVKLEDHEAKRPKLEKVEQR